MKITKLLIGFASLFLFANYSFAAGQNFIPPNKNESFAETMYRLNNNSAYWYGLTKDGYPNPTPTKPLVTPATNTYGNFSLVTEATKPVAKTRLPFQFGGGAPEEIADVTAKFKMRSAAGAIIRTAAKLSTPLVIGSAIYDIAKELCYDLSRTPEGELVITSECGAQMYFYHLNGYYFSDNYKLATHVLNNQTLYRNVFGVPAQASITSWTTEVVLSGGTPITTKALYTTNLQPNLTSYQASRYQTQYPCAGQLKPHPTTGQCGTPVPEVVDSQALEDAIANKTDWTNSPKILEAIRKALEAGEQVETDPPAINGPAQSAERTSGITNKPDGTIETTKVINHYTYAGNSISSTTTSTTTNYNTTNNTTTTTTVINNNPETKPEEPKDECKDNPDRIGCMEQDTPTDEIPKDNKNITYTAETPLAGTGTCPAPMTMQVFGTSLTLSYASICMAASDYMRPILLLLASFAAALIVIRTLRE